MEKYVICKPMRCENKNGYRTACVCVRGACHSSEPYTREHAQWTLEKALEMPENTASPIDITVHTTVVYLRSVCWNALVDGGLAFALSRRNRATCVCTVYVRARARCIRTIVHTAHASKFGECSARWNWMCYVRNTKKQRMRVYEMCNVYICTKWGLPAPNACASV